MTIYFTKHIDFQIQKVDEKRKADDSPDKEVKLEAFNKKLMTAQEQREAILNSLQERLKEHVSLGNSY